MTAHLVATFGVYGACLVIAFVAGLFPLVSIEAFLVGYSALVDVPPLQVAMMILLAATGHQIAKTVSWVAGIGALENRRVKPLIDRWRPRIDRWNRHPNWMFFFAGAIGVPPMLLIGFIAEPILRMRFWPFTFACFSLRTLRYAVLAIVPLLIK